MEKQRVDLFLLLNMLRRICLGAACAACDDGGNDPARDVEGAIEIKLAK